MDIREYFSLSSADRLPETRTLILISAHSERWPVHEYMHQIMCVCRHVPTRVHACVRGFSYVARIGPLLA